MAKRICAKVEKVMYQSSSINLSIESIMAKYNIPRQAFHRGQMQYVTCYGKFSNRLGAIMHGIYDKFVALLQTRITKMMTVIMLLCFIQ